MRNHAAVLSLNLIHVWQGKEFVSILQVPAVVKKIIILYSAKLPVKTMPAKTASAENVSSSRLWGSLCRTVSQLFKKLPSWTSGSLWMPQYESRMLWWFWFIVRTYLWLRFWLWWLRLRQKSLLQASSRSWWWLLWRKIIGFSRFSCLLPNSNSVFSR